jgi:hypothetical protein
MGRGRITEKGKNVGGKRIVKREKSGEGKIGEGGLGQEEDKRVIRRGEKGREKIRAAGG